MKPKTGIRTLPVRLDSKLYGQLSLQAQAEERSMNEVMRNAIESHLETHPIPRDRLRALAARVVAQDAELLEALKRA